MDEADINGSVIDVDGRYPAKGYAKNTISKELVYIISVSDKVCVSGKDPVLFGAGDSVFIDKSEEFYWEGKFSSYMVCTP
ncbi:MAG: hypothetical protein ACI9T8_000622, partial [Candidatus Saccharimonadales bacterium]